MLLFLHLNHYFMHFTQELTQGTLLKRYKRFLADIKLSNGEVVTAHCPNSGSMKTCLENDAPVLLSHSSNPSRKNAFTWELIYLDGGWVCINTQHANTVAFEAVQAGVIPSLSGFNLVKREVTFGDSRFDLYAERGDEKWFIEVKSVTLKLNGEASFPDSVTTRGQKHLLTLAEAKSQGYHTAMLYVLMRSDVQFFRPAKEIDPVYASTLKEVAKKGVEVIVAGTTITPRGIIIDREIPFEI